MSLRGAAARSLLRLSYRAEAVLAAFIDAESLLEFNRGTFFRDAADWIALAESGLDEHETRIVGGLPRPGRALCLGSGAGREAFALARRGWSVTGVEQVEPLVRFSQDRAAELGLDARFIRCDMTRLELDEKFDAVFMLNIAYGYVPSRRRRVALLARCLERLTPGGRCVLSFAVRAPGLREARWYPRLKLAAALAGNPEYELGDRVDSSPTFFRLFPSSETVAEEAREAGFTTVELLSPTAFDHFALLAR